jgi:hypothetical protein
VRYDWTLGIGHWANRTLGIGKKACAGHWPNRALAKQGISHFFENRYRYTLLGYLGRDVIAPDRVFVVRTLVFS